MLKVSGLAARYGMHEALSGINLYVDADEIVVILGANGAGKSTLLKAISGICEGNSHGDITLHGQSISDLDPALIVERGIAFVPEGRGIFGDLSVRENLLLGAYADHARHSQQENLRRVLTLFPKLAERQKQIARTMSGGEQQMVAIGRALMSAPSILMLDEPSLGLSPLLCKELFSSLKQVRESGVGILLVEQNAKQSLAIADRGYLLENGKITGEDTASNLLHDPAVQAAYLGGAVSKSSIAATTATADKNRTATAFVPRPGPPTPTTVAAGSVAGVDIEALVARASSAAANLKTTTGAFAVKPDAGNDKPATESALPSPVAGTALPLTQDTRVKQMLAEFEQAAQNASSGARRSSPRRVSSDAVDDDPRKLPHIPVFRKNTVTVFRRDSTGKLRKQERS